MERNQIRYSKYTFYRLHTLLLVIPDSTRRPYDLE
jgi:hypothetical protein